MRTGTVLGRPHVTHAVTSGALSLQLCRILHNLTQFVIQSHLVHFFPSRFLEPSVGKVSAALHSPPLSLLMEHWHWSCFHLAGPPVITTWCSDFLAQHAVEKQNTSILAGSRLSPAPAEPRSSSDIRPVVKNVGER